MNLPSFSLPASDGKTYTEKDFEKGIFVLYLYPKDMTPGCTTESCDFRDAQPNFTKEGVQIFGLSKDPLRSHEKFITKHKLPFVLLSDEETMLISALGAWQEKKFMGKTYMGTVRSTFVIYNGEIVQEWRGVKVKGHVQEVLDSLSSLT